MKVIVCGAGQVGFNIARYLAAAGNDVTVIDQRPDLTERIGESLDIQAITGFASHPDTLAQAGAGDADILLAVTLSDEVNMVACQVAHSLFDVPTKIARIRNQGYLQGRWSHLFRRDHLPIDVVISPEVEVAHAIARRLEVPGATDVIPFAEDRVRLIGVRCGEECPVLDTPLRQLTFLFPDLAVETQHTPGLLAGLEEALNESPGLGFRKTLIVNSDSPTIPSRRSASSTTTASRTAAAETASSSPTAIAHGTPRRATPTARARSRTGVTR